MDDLDYELLAWLERGNAMFRPADPTTESRREFQQTAQRVLELRAHGLISVLACHISLAESGDYLLIGPCTLSADGRAALVNHCRLGGRRPRPAWWVPSL